jgi:hypothetical protein
LVVGALGLEALAALARALSASLAVSAGLLLPPLWRGSGTLSGSGAGLADGLGAAAGLAGAGCGAFAAGALLFAACCSDLAGAAFGGAAGLPEATSSGREGSGAGASPDERAGPGSRCSPWP